MAGQRKLQASSAQVAQALEGLDYPKRKREIIDYAVRHTATHNPRIIRVLKRIPDREYGSRADVGKGFEEETS